MKTDIVRSIILKINNITNRIETALYTKSITSAVLKATVKRCVLRRGQFVPIIPQLNNRESFRCVRLQLLREEHPGKTIQAFKGKSKDFIMIFMDN